MASKKMTQAVSQEALSHEAHHHHHQCKDSGCQHCPSCAPVPAPTQPVATLSAAGTTQDIYCNQHSFTNFCQLQVFLEQDPEDERVTNSTQLSLQPVLWRGCQAAPWREANPVLTYSHRVTTRRLNLGCDCSVIFQRMSLRDGQNHLMKTSHSRRLTLSLTGCLNLKPTIGHMQDGQAPSAITPGRGDLNMECQSTGVMLRNVSLVLSTLK